MGEVYFGLIRKWLERIILNGGIPREPTSESVLLISVVND